MSNTAYLSVLPSALIAVNRESSIVYLNPAAENLFATSAQQVVGKSLSTLLALNTSEQAMLAEAFSRSQQRSLYEHDLSLPQGHMRATLHISPVAGEENVVEQALLTIEKPTGLHAATASEWKKETTRAAGVMAAMLAHEVKNPLSGIRGAAQLLKDEVPKEHQPLTELICVETDRIRDLLDQVDIFATDTPRKTCPVNIHEVLQHAISVARAGVAVGVTIEERYDPSLPPVLGDKDLLVQLFLNLIKNAAEALKGQKGAAITVKTAYRSGYKIRIDPAKGEGALPIAVSIEDNGPGIAPQLRSQLFEPFVSSKEEGRGLGLAVVAKIASDLGAVVELDEEYEKGARFNVMLPCA